MNQLLDVIRNAIKRQISKIAGWLNRFSGGRISPNLVTLTGFAAHIGIAYLIASRHPIWAGGLLIVFGLFDSLDGELARLQNKAGSAGMLLDASTDRMKEVLLYVGTADFFVELGYPVYAIWAVAACGASICVSYVKAKGETAVKDSRLSPNQINRLFSDGLARFEIRMFLLIVGLFTALLPEMLVLITILSSYTAVSRLYKISRAIDV